MRKQTLFLFLIVVSFPGYGQLKNFEGSIDYGVEVRSKVKGVSDEQMMTMLGLGNKATIIIKNGDYLLMSGFYKQYSILEKQRVFMKFRNIDTLYWLDYDSDTTGLIKVVKLKEEKVIAGESCKSMLMETTTGSCKYFYAPALYRDPAYDTTYKFGLFNVYSKETSSVWLGKDNQTRNYSTIYLATRISKRKVNDGETRLPDLPQEKFVFERLQKDPVFNREEGWNNYVAGKLNAELGAKYIRIPKGETEKRQSVMVNFTIDMSGNVTDVRVINSKDVHSKLAEEAVRVISESPRWTPATLYGEKIIFTLQQAVTFQATK